jgi:hypothetical protein
MMMRRRRWEGGIALLHGGQFLLLFELAVGVEGGGRENLAGGAARLLVVAGGGGRPAGEP